MNKTFRLVWNELARAWVAVSEIAKARGKRASGAVLIAAGLVAVSPAPTFAAPPAPTQLPTGGQIVGGAAAGSIATSGNTMTVTQTQPRIIANWQSFDIGAAARVNFAQPSASSIALNRVLNQNPTTILGQLSANGQVMLINPAGIVFGQGSQVNVGALVASTLALSDANFMAGKYSFGKDASGLAGSLVNQGRIVTPTGGIVAFLAPVVKNAGQIETPQGSTLLAAAGAIDVDFTGDGLITYRLTGGAANALVDNSGSITADGGLAVLTAKSADAVTQAVVNNSGVVRARTLAGRHGRIVLEADVDNGETHVTGTLDASGRNAGEQGGTVALLGEKVGLFDAARVDVVGDAGGGTVLIGGNWQGHGPERNADYSYVSTAASIDVSALGSGHGGTAVVWADQATRFYGNISAKGGALSGNGGKVEVSGKDYLDFNGTVSTLAPNGLSGLLLLDPKNIAIVTADPGGANSRTAAPDFNAGGGTPYAVNAAETSWITPTQLVSLLNTAAVTMFAANDITVTDAVDATANTGNFSLSLTAGRNVNINADLTLRGAFYAGANTYSTATANRDANGGSYGFLMQSGATINTDAGTGGSRLIDITVSTAGGTAAIATIGKLTSGAGYGINIRADAPTFNGGADSIQKITDTNANVVKLTLTPYSSSKDYVIGTGGMAGTDYILDPTLFSSVIKDGQGQINLGINGDYLSRKMSINGPLTIKDTLVFYMRATGGELVLNGALTASSAVGTASLIFNQGGSIQTGTKFTQTSSGSTTGNLSVSIDADSVVLGGAAGSIQGSGMLSISPTTTSRNAEYGRPDGTSEVNLFGLSLSELATVGNGFVQGFNLGVSATGTTTIYGTLNFVNTTKIGNYLGTALTLDSTAQITMAVNKNLTLQGGNLLRQTNGATVSTSGTGTMTMYSKEIDLQGAANSINGANALTLDTAAARTIKLGGTDDATMFSLTSSELATLGSGFTGLTFGSTDYAGSLTIAGPITLNSSTTFKKPTTGSFTVDATPTVTGAITFTDTTAALALNASVSATNGFTRTGPTTVGADNLTVSAGTGTATFSSTVTHGANNFTVTADNVTLSGNWIGTGARIVQPTTTTRTIGLSNGAGAFAVDGGELSRLQNDTPSSVTIGRSDGTGAITGNATGGNQITFNDPLILRGGAIDLTHANNDFSGTLSLVSNGAGAVTIRDVNALALGTVSLGTGTFTLTAGGAITQTGAITQSAGAGAVSITAGANDITLSNTGNNFTGSVSVVTGRNIALLDSDTLTLGAITSTGTVDVATASGNLTVSGNISTTNTTATALTLNAGKSAAAGTIAGGQIIITGTPTITVGAGGTAKFFSGSSAGSTGLAAKAPTGNRYNSDETSTLSPALGSGLYAIYREANVTALTFTLASTTKTYGDANPTLPAFSLTTGAFAAGDSISLLDWGSAATQFKAVGTYAYGTSNLLSPTFTCAVAGCAANYNLSWVNSFVITTRPITVTADAKSRIYGAADPALTYAVTAGSIVNGDPFSGTLSRAAGNNVGSYVIGQNTLSAGSNYTFTYVAANLDITKKPLTVTGSTATNKTYDGNNTAAATVGTVSGFVGTETVTATLTSGTFSDQHAALNKTVTLAYTLADGSNGGLAGNYSLSSDTTTATITAATLTPTITNTGVTKTYDGTSASGIIPTYSFAGLVAGDTTATLTNTGRAYNDAHVGAANKVTVAGLAIDSISGTNSSVAGDYVLDATAKDVTAAITAATLIPTVSNTGVTKTYDGTTASAITPTYNFTGLVSGDTDAALTNTGKVYDNAHVVGASKVTVAGLVIGTLTGNKGSVASDYVLDATAKDVTASITAATLTPTLSNTGVTKTYDGTTASSITPTYSFTGLVSGDTDAALTHTGKLYDNAHVLGASKVTVAGLMLTSITGSNSSVVTDYALDATSKDVAATITPVPTPPVTIPVPTLPFVPPVTSPLAPPPVIAPPAATPPDSTPPPPSTLLGGTATSTPPSPPAGTSDTPPAPPVSTPPVVTPPAATRSDSTPPLPFTPLGGTATSTPPSPPAGTSDKPPALPVSTPPVATSPDSAPPARSTPPGGTGTSTPPSPPAGTSDTAPAPPVSTPPVATSPAATPPDSTPPSPSTPSGTGTGTIGTLNFGTTPGGSPVQFIVSGNTTTMILSSGGQGGQASAKGESAGLTGAAGDGTARSSSVLLFNLSGTTMAPAGALTVVEQGQSLKASPAASEVSSIPSLNQASMRFVSVDYRLPSGTQNQVTVGVSPDGMLMVKVPAGVKATMDDRSIVLIGMAIAKERLDVQPSNVKGVVIQVGE